MTVVYLGGKADGTVRDKQSSAATYIMLLYLGSFRYVEEVYIPIGRIRNTIFVKYLYTRLT